MLEADRPYSDHIYEPERIALARTIIEKEARKLFLGLPDEAWRAIDQSIAGWADKPEAYHLESDGPRDFWDSFAAIMESVKLKPNFTSWITAENVHWSKVALSIRDIQMTSPLGQLKAVPGLDLRADLPFAELADVLASHPEALPEQKRQIDQHSTDPAQDTYPIIVRQTPAGLFKVMDGNRRTLRALLYGKSDIEAWAGKIDGPKPVNFWVPVNDMFQLVKVFQSAVEANDEQLRQAVALVLRAHFGASNVAEQAYKNRIGNQNDIANQLYVLAKQS